MKPLKTPSLILIFAFALLLINQSFGQSESTVTPITAICLTNGKLISGSDDGLQVHSLKTLKPTERIPSEIEKHYSIVPSPDGSKLAVAGGTPSELGIIEIFSLPEMELVKRFAGFDDIATDVAWRSEKELVAASVTGNCCVFNLKEKSPPPFNVHSRPISSIESLASQEIVSAGKDNSIRVWKPASPEKVRVLNNHIDIVNDVAVQPTQKDQALALIASVSDDGTARFWQPTIGRMVRFTRLESNPTSVIWNQDGSQAIVGCRDGSIILIDPKTAKPTSAFKAKGWIYSMTLVADDNLVIVAGEQGLQRIELSK